MNFNEEGEQESRQQQQQYRFKYFSRMFLSRWFSSFFIEDSSQFFSHRNTKAPLMISNFHVSYSFIDFSRLTFIARSRKLKKEKIWKLPSSFHLPNLRHFRHRKAVACVRNTSQFSLNGTEKFE